MIRSSPKGLWFFCLVSPLESPKVMGLKGIHHPNALHCFTGLVFFPWCGKEEQNDGTVVNHLWTMHYRFGLICSGCLCCPLTTSEAMQVMAEAAGSLGKWCQRGRWGARWCIYVRLICPNDPLQPEHCLPQWQWHKCPKLPNLFRTLILFFEYSYNFSVVMFTTLYKCTYFCSKIKIR